MSGSATKGPGTKGPGFSIGDTRVGPDEPLYIIAEAGVNHENDLDVAREMIRRAADAGAHAIKFQSYKAGRLASRFSPAYWDRSKEPTGSQHELFTRFDHLDIDDYLALAEHAREHGIDFLTTVFDEVFLEGLDAVLPAYKIASADITHLPLMTRIARKGKPVILSTGAATLAEIDDALRVLHSNGCEHVALLHCVLNYPCAPEDANLEAIRSLARTFPDVVVGYSDHVPPEHGIVQMTTAWMLGARIVEKHFTLDKSLPGNDHYHAMDPDDLKRFHAQHRFVESLLGNGRLGYEANQDAARQHARRSLVAAADLRAGEPLEESMVAVKRPGHGIAPRHLETLVGARPRIDIDADTILQWDMFLDVNA